MTPLTWSALAPAERAAALARPLRADDAALRARVAEIIADVGTRGRAAVDMWAAELDGHRSTALKIDAAAVAAAEASVSAADRAALAFAAANVRRYHEAIRPADSAAIEVASGAWVRREWRAIGSVGLYVPGGTAPLFSTLLHLAIPARIAGCPAITVVTPPQRGGGTHPMVVLAAHLAGIERLWLVGGVQAVAALTFGLDAADGQPALPRADKIFGPGNAWVAEAKRQAAELMGGPAIDLPAGPSELMVVADASADPARVAADLLSQAEHDADAQVMLVAVGDGVAQRIAAEVAAQLAALPRRALAEAALASSRTIVTSGREEALTVVNAYAAEHLSLHVREPEGWVKLIRSAGTVFAGADSAETFGDYCSGPSHVLPTGGAARAWSGVSVQSFMTSFAVQWATAAGARTLAAPAAALARAEGLEAHARAAEARA
ncbi:MAG: histidinol dehydrogenase [Sphingomonadaceae bacterium]|nr:histidinol dehydrogenase [Sphingomonadaceae bacterium]